jgi:hypothetical protein
MINLGDIVKLPSVDDYASQGLKFWWSGQVGIVIEKDVKGLHNPGTSDRYERDECRVLIGDRWCWFAEEGLELINESR